MITIDKRINDNPEYYELTVGGEVDASSSIHLEEGLKSAMNISKSIIVNLSDLEYISSAGLGVFMSVIEDLKHKKINLVLFGMPQKVYEVFELLGLDQMLNIQKAKPEALKAIM